MAENDGMPTLPKKCGPYISSVTSRGMNLVIRGVVLFFIGVFLALVLNLLQIQRNVTLFPPDVITSIFSSAWWVPPCCGTASGKFSHVSMPGVLREVVAKNCVRGGEDKILPYSITVLIELLVSFQSFCIHKYTCPGISFCPFLGHLRTLQGTWEGYILPSSHKKLVGLSGPDGLVVLMEMLDMSCKVHCLILDF